MEHERKTIGFLFGGQSSEHGISCVSAASMIKNIDEVKYDVIRIGITEDGKWWIYRGDTESIKSGVWKNDAANLIPAVISPCSAHHGLLILDKEKKTYRIQRLDCVLSILHGENGEDGVMQGLLKLSGIPFVGCDTRSSALSMDKAAAKALAQNAGIPVADYIVVTRASFSADPQALIALAAKKLSYPLFVKPAGTGSSVGISKVHNEREFNSALEAAFSFDNKLLIEKCMTGKETEVAILERDGKLIASVCGEVFAAGEFYDYESKYHDSRSETFIPARIPESVSDRVRAYALKIFELLGCNGFSRVDFFVDGENIVFNEINTLPGFTEISLYPALLAHMGTSYTELLTALIENAPQAR